MVVAVEVRSSDLHAASEHQAQSPSRFIRQLDFAHHQPGHQKRLVLPVVRATVIITCIHFELRPKVFANSVLAHRVP